MATIKGIAEGTAWVQDPAASPHLPCGVPSLLNTPVLGMGEDTGPLWTTFDRLDGDPRGLFNSPDEGPVLDLGDMDFSTLDVEDLDRILQGTGDVPGDLSEDSTLFPADVPCLPDAHAIKQEQSHQDNRSSDFILRTLSHDHDYFDKNEDWSILSEFLSEVEPCQSSLAQRQGSISLQAFNKVVESTMKEDMSAAFLETDPSFMDTNIDLTPYLSGEGRTVKVEAPPSPAPSPTQAGTARGGKSPAVKDHKYWDRRQKNNVASARARLTRKERRTELKREKVDLEDRNLFLKAEIQRLEEMTAEWKDRLLQTIAAK